MASRFGVEKSAAPGYLCQINGSDRKGKQKERKTVKTNILVLLLAAIAVVPSVAQTWSEIVLHSFANPPKGATPYAGVIRDSAGNLYGTTYAGGTAGLGVVYKLDASGHETVLYSFTGGADGSF